MNGVIGFLDLLKTTSLTDEQSDYVNLIADSSQSLLSILNDVLDYSKIEAGEACSLSFCRFPLAMSFARSAAFSCLRRKSRD